MSRKWVKVTGDHTSKIVEDHKDGTYTVWSYSAFGAIGSTGSPKPNIKISEPSTKADFAEIKRLEEMLKTADDRSRAAYYSHGGQGNV